jgi:hypothetical protein
MRELLADHDRVASREPTMVSELSEGNEMLSIEQIHEAIAMITNGLHEAGHSAWANSLSMDASCAIEVIADHEATWLEVKSDLVEGN